MAFLGLLRPFCGPFFRWVCIPLGWVAFVACGAFLGLVIPFACVRCPPAKGEGPFLSLSFAVSVCVSFRVSIFAGLAVCVCLYAKKRNSPLYGLFLLGWWSCLFSPIEQIRTLRAGYRFGLLPLFCRGLPSSLGPWGLQYSINLLCRWPRCVLYTCRR